MPTTPTSFPLPSPLTSSFGLLNRGHMTPMGPLSGPMFPHHLPPHGLSLDGPPFRHSILPSRTIDPQENLEQYMEIEKPETEKLQQMVTDLNEKVREPNECAICHRVLSCKSALQMHYRIHTGERPFKCKICNRKFTTKGNLKTHMGVHRSKPALRMLHTCHICHKPFGNILQLQQHIRIHTNHAGPHPHMPHLPFMGPFSGWPNGPKPGLPHPSMLGLPVPHMPEHRMLMSQSGPFDLSSAKRKEEPRELDLSKREPREDGEGKAYDRSQEEEDYRQELEDEEGLLDEDDFDDEAINDEEMEEDEGMLMDEQDEGEEGEGPYGYPREGSNSGPASQDPHSALSENDDQERPKSNVSASGYPSNASGYKSQTQPPKTPDVVDGFLNPASLPPARGGNPSLAALEDSIKNIESTVSQSGFERFRSSMGLGAGPFGPLMDKSLSPGAQLGSSPVSPRSAFSEGSEGGDPAARFASLGVDFPGGFPFLGAGLDPFGGRGGKGTTCPTCFKTFACRSALDIHLRSHTKERPFKCDECDKAFSTKGNLKQHQLTHKEGGGVDDASCSSTSNSGHQQADRSHDEEGQESNPASERTQEPREGEESHEGGEEERQINGEASPNAEVRPPSTSSSSSEQHRSSNSSQVSPAGRSTKNNNNVEGCPNINSISNNNNGNNNNYNSNNGSNNNGNSSNNSSSSSNSGNSPRRPRHVCDTCNKPFSSASALQIHTRTHTGDKPFKCNVCEKAFTTRGNLKVHMGTHMYNNSPSRRGRRMSIDAPFLSSLPFMPGGFPSRQPGPPLPPSAEMMYYHSMLNGMGPRPNEIPVIQSLNGALGHHHPLASPPIFPFPPHHMFPGREHPSRDVRGEEEARKDAADLSLARSRRESGERDSLDRDRAEAYRMADRERSSHRDRSRSPISRSSFRGERSPSPARSSAASTPPRTPHDVTGLMTSSGELDLSMKPSGAPVPASGFGMPKSSKTSPYAPLTSPPARASKPSPSPAAPAPTSPLHPRENGGEGVLSSSKTTLMPPSASWLGFGPSCPHCNQAFPTTGALEQHLQNEHASKNESRSATAGGPPKAITA